MTGEGRMLSGGVPRATALWRRVDGTGFDRCTLEDVPTGHRLAGTAVFHLDGTSYEIRYSVLTDAEWNTVTVGAHVQGPASQRRLALAADGGGTWSSGDVPLVELFGARDVDLAWTPATNTLPIRRLDLSVGDRADVAVAYVAFPDHELDRSQQSYIRVDESRYRYASDGFEAELVVDDAGLVVDYSGGWERIASR